MLRNTYSKSRVTKLCLYGDNKIKMVIDNTNKSVQTALKYKRFNTKLLKDFGGWLTAHCSCLNGGRSLAFGTSWPLNLKSIENTTIQENICLILSPNTEKLNIRKQSYKSTYISVPLVPKVKKTKEQSLQRPLKKHTKN